MTRKPPHRDILDNRPNPPTPREPLPDLPYPDICAHLPQPPKPSKLPKTVFIVGSGPNGAEPFKRIPPDACCIALNSAILLKRDWRWWMAFDHRLVDDPWWATVKVKRPTKILFGARLANRIYLERDVRESIQCHYYFRYHPGISGAAFVPGQPLLIPGILRGLTVAGCALQFAYYGGAKEVYLCGIDMQGQNHIDGHVNIDEVYKGVWPWCRNLSRLIHALAERGMTTQTISETALEVRLAKI
jgi:hypothetical protein